MLMLMWSSQGRRHRVKNRPLPFFELFSARVGQAKILLSVLFKSITLLKAYLARQLVDSKTSSKHCTVPYSGFTLVELVAVLAVMGLLTAFVTWRIGNFDYWRQESFLRKFRETISFLHHQAVFDQMYYALEVDLLEPSKPKYKVGVFNPVPPAGAAAGAVPAGGNLSASLAFFLSPSVGTDQTFTPSPTFPSLAEPVEFPTGIAVQDIRTLSGKLRAEEIEKVYVLFSPRGFSEFAVFHLLVAGAQVTILVNPFTGGTEFYRGYRDFTWTYGTRKQES